MTKVAAPAHRDQQRAKVSSPEISPGETAFRPVKPSARGWIHFYAALAAAPTGLALVARTAATSSAAVTAACAVYAAALVAMFTVSATYHRHDWHGRYARRWVKRADHSMIFLFIAGTYTPFAILALPGSMAGVVLVAVWSAATAGVALKVLWPQAPRWVGVPLYLALGWLGVILVPDLLAAGHIAAIALLAAGGIAYSIGAVCYGVRRPVGRPRVFGYHEYFHALVVVAAACHVVAVALLL